MIAHRSLPWILIPLLVALLTLILSLYWAPLIFLSVILLFLACFFLIFFRDPQRSIGKGIISPADGTLQACDRITDHDLGTCQKISIFMNLWNVHVNRAPVGGTLVTLRHHPGSHKPAFGDTKGNESLIYLFDTPLGHVKLVQITGVVARRIVPYITEGQKVQKGDRIGIIRFGSRVELFLPCNIQILPQVGERVAAGNTLGVHPTQTL